MATWRRAPAAAAAAGLAVLCLVLVTACAPPASDDLTVLEPSPTPQGTASWGPSAEPSPSTLSAPSPSPSASPTEPTPDGPAGEPTPTPPPAPTPAPTEPTAPSEPDRLQWGDDGTEVVALQERLLALGYWLPVVDGSFGHDTHHAVVALQKAAGIARDGIVGPVTEQALADGPTPQPRSTSGTVIEIDRSGQLLLLVSEGEVRWVFDTSTGRSGWTTPSGWFQVRREIDGYRHAPLGVLYRPKYFNSGIAIHGYPSVPPHPASHGCVRVTNAAMDWLWAHDEAPIGRAVWVY